MANDSNLARIVANPDILGGKPIIRGTRISVEFILDLLAAGAKEDEVLLDYRHLQAEDLRACLEYAARASRNEILVDLERVG
jgi:uncharacterized protein (DUF433 family)